jgi:hypothetical protein
MDACMSEELDYVDVHYSKNVAGINENKEIVSR